MKLFKTLALTTVVLLAAAGSANAKECWKNKASGTGATLQEAAKLAGENLERNADLHMLKHPDFKFNHFRTWSFSCRTNSGKFKIDRNATRAEFDSELNRIFAVNGPGTCKVSLTACWK